MDPRRDIDISGNRVVNVSDPTENDHAATKHYVDAVHTLTPVDDVHEYTRYINLRRYTQHSLTRLCGIEWTWEWEADKEEKKSTEGTTGPHNLLESDICPTTLQIIPQQLRGRYIYVKYKFPVHVQDWKISVTFEDHHPPFDFRYIWQVSNNGERYYTITDPPTEVKTMIFQRRCGIDAEMLFENENEANIRAEYWRMFITNGNFENHFYINQLYMSVAP